MGGCKSIPPFHHSHCKEIAILIISFIGNTRRYGSTRFVPDKEVYGRPSPLHKMHSPARCTTVKGKMSSHSLMRIASEKTTHDKGTPG